MLIIQPLTPAFKLFARHVCRVLWFFVITAGLHTPNVFAQHNVVHASFGLASNQFSFSVLGGREWSLAKREKWIWGAGVRYTGYRGTEQYYATAPARLTTGSTGPLVLFKPNIPGNMDSIQINSPSVHAVNLFLQIRYRLAQQWQVGFNIDIAGASFGSRKPATYINGTVMGVTQATPSSFNILLVSDNDRGSLNSEFFVLYQPAGQLAIKAGAQFLFTEYTTSDKVQQVPAENDRFRNKSLMVSLGVVKYFK